MIEVEVTSENANDGIPGEADCCALAIAIKETHFPEDHIIVEVNSDGSVTVMEKGKYEEDTGATPREELYTLYPDIEQTDEITLFIEDYDTSSGVDDFDEIEYMQFPYNFKFHRES